MKTEICVAESNPKTHGVGIDNPQKCPAKTKKVYSVGEVVNRTRFTKEMCIRALEDGAEPHEFLKAIVVDPTLTFTDFIPTKRGGLITIERGASLEERIDCAKAILPYYASKKPVQVDHGGEIKIICALAETALDGKTLDAITGQIIEGEIIDDGDEDA